MQTWVSIRDFFSKMTPNFWMVVFKTWYFLPNNPNKTFVNRDKRYSDNTNNNNNNNKKKNSASVFVLCVIFCIWFSVNYCYFCIINNFGTVLISSLGFETKPEPLYYRMFATVCDLFDVFFFSCAYAEVWRTWSRIPRLWKRGSPISSSRGSWIM